MASRLPDPRELTLPSSTILKYYAYKSTVTFGFFWPVYTLFLLDRGLNYTQIGVLEGVSAGFVVVGEIPTGYVTDRIGRRNGLLLSSAFFSLSILGFAVAETFASFLVLWTLWALGLSFYSGSGDAWLYDSLKGELREDEYTRVRGRGESVNQWVTAGMMLVAGLLYSVDPRLPFVAGGVVLASGIPVILTMPRTEVTASDEGFSILEALPVIRRKLSEPPLRSFVIYMALFFGIVQAADEFVQPIATRTLGLPEPGLGPLYFGFTVAAAIASYYASEIEASLSTRRATLVLPALVGVFFVAPFVVPLAAFPMFFVMKSAQTAMRPIASGYINDHVESVGRATTLSAVAMVYAMVRLPLKPLAGGVADLASPVFAIAALGAFFLVGATALYLVESPVSRTDRRAPTSPE